MDEADLAAAVQAVCAVITRFFTGLATTLAVQKCCRSRPCPSEQRARRRGAVMEAAVQQGGRNGQGPAAAP